VEGHQTHVTLDRHVERGDVAVADQGLRLAPDQVVVQRGQQARGPVAAAHAPDRIDRVVGEHRIEIVGPGRVGARQVPLALVHVLAGPHPEAEGFDGLRREADAVRLVGGRGGRDQPDGLARREPTGPDERHVPILPRARLDSLLERG
jgi:hypothetical protein